MPILLSSLVLGAIFAFLFLYDYFKTKASAPKLPPGPLGLPLVGVLPFLGKYPERQFAEWSRKYGPVMSVRIGLKNYVVLNTYNAIQQTLLKRSSNFAGRPNVSLFQRISNEHGLVLLDNTPVWKAQRKFGFSAFRELGSFSTKMENSISEELEYLVDAINSHRGKPFDILSNLSNAVANNMCNLVMGKRFDYDDPKFEAIISDVREVFSDPQTNKLFVLLAFAPSLVHLPSVSRDAKLLVAKLNAAQDMFQEIIDDHKSSCDENSARDFIDKFLIEMKKSNDPSFTDFQLIQFMRDLLVAGTETLTNTLRWSILCLIHYPEVQHKLRQEINDVLGESVSVRMSNKEKLPYVCAFIQEVFRFRTMVPMSVLHRTTTDVHIDDYVIPKNTTVLPNLWAVHNDGARWPEPEKFLPERHLDENGNFVSSPHIIPFSVGGRRCLGEQMARMQVFMFLVTMVRGFRFEKDPDVKELPDINYGSNGILFVPRDFKIVAKEI